MITTREIVDRLKDIYDKLAAAASFRWGVVGSTRPPLVRLDADTDPVIVGTIAPLTVGSRVLVLLQNRKNTVVGSAGGDPNLIVIDGTAYQRSGTLTATPSAFTAWAGLYYATVTIPDALKTAPTGWAYIWTLVEGASGSCWMAGKTGVNNQFVVSAVTTRNPVTLAWQLVKI